MSFRDILADKEKVKVITKAAFDTIDINKTGYLERKEIEALLINITKDLNVKKPINEEIDDVMKELAKDKNGKITPKEFQVVVEQILESMAQAIEADTTTSKFAV